GTISPSSQSIYSGNTATLTVTPTTGYTATMSGSCPAGTLTGTSYVTGAITAGCTVTATFANSGTGAIAWDSTHKNSHMTITNQLSVAGSSATWQTVLANTGAANTGFVEYVIGAGSYSTVMLGLVPAGFSVADGSYIGGTASSWG